MAVLLVIVMAGAMLPDAMVTAKEQEDIFPYAIFASSDKEGAVTVNAQNTCVNGRILTNGTIISGGNMNLNGTKTEHAGVKMLHITESLKKDYFTGDSVMEHTGDYECGETNVSISSPMYIGGKAALSGNISLNAGIMAQGDISIKGGVINTNNSIICSKTGNITVDSSSVNLNGLLYAPYGSVELTSPNLNLNNIIIIADSVKLNCSCANVNYSSSMGKVVGAAGDDGTDAEINDDTEIFAFGGYNKENNSIDIEWYTDSDKGNFGIWVSDDNKEYKKAASVKDETSYQYILAEEFEKKYFKVSLSGKSGSIESVPFIVTKTEDGYESDFLDSDGDGLYDFVEITCGTDISKKDTDGDGLTDFEEACLTETDPLKYDSVKKGISDAEADSDQDGLSNIREVGLGTDPKTADTDKDGLSDGDEVNVYGTDPLLYDTDKDGLKDGDEPHIGLDPKNPRTYGVPDAEYRVNQEISADSIVLSEINTPESPYKLSVDVTAAGYVEGNLTAGETGYANVIRNDSMLGLAAELKYNNPEAVDSVTLKFEISDEYEENVLGLCPENEELNGIKRFNVFKYFEDINMLLPIETKFDLDKNIVYTEVDELGTYCLMDMEQWFVSLGIFGEEYQPQPMLFSLASCMSETVSPDRFSKEDSRIGIKDDAVGEETVSLLSSEQRLSSAPGSQKLVTPIDVVMVLQTSGQFGGVFELQKETILDVMERLAADYGSGNVRFCVITYGATETDILRNSMNSVWFTDSVEFKNKLEEIDYDFKYSFDEYADRGNAFRRLLNSNEVVFRENSSKFIFQLINGTSYVGDLYFDQISTCERLGINYSELMPQECYYVDEDYKRAVDEAIAATKGMNITYTYNAGTDVYEHICKNAAPPQNIFCAIVPLDYKEITLNSILERNGKTDTDEDSITDWNEIENTLIKWNTDGTVKLPTFGECKKLAKKPYADSGLLRFSVKAGFEGRKVDETPILPIRSNPTKEDTDGDGLLDGKAVYDKYEYEDKERNIAIAPKDPDPMKKSEYAGIWLSRIHEIKVREKTAYNYSDEYYKPQKLKVNWKDKTINVYEVLMSHLSTIGSETLDFRYDDKKLALHSDTTQWQKQFGYNDFYDMVFRTFTKMDKGKYDFVYNGTNYVLWAWKGDYLNLGPGAELGFYYQDKLLEDAKENLGIEHWKVGGTLPMTLSLYQRANENSSFFSRYHWFPGEEQWWITGFVPDVYHIEKIDENDLIHVSSVDFKGREGMLEELKGKYYGKDEGENLIFDVEDKKVWIIF